MRFILILLLQVMLFANSYNFNEFKYVSAIKTYFKKSGHIKIDKDKIIITYTKPKYKKVIKKDNNISMEDSSGKIYHLKGKASYYAGIFISIMAKLGNFNQIKSNKDFTVSKDSNIYTISFRGDLSDAITKAKVETKNSKVLSFKIFMPNKDTLKIVKK
ncbi:MAG: hypothetical protein GXP61_00415 [Epsilonproteobacteria bacterium]|nr:hypothetical protein [Campylobacterota bacterium]